MIADNREMVTLLMNASAGVTGVVEQSKSLTLHSGSKAGNAVLRPLMSPNLPTQRV